MRKQDREKDHTRGKILSLLCGANHTTSDLARKLEISANGARWHLDRLQQEGLVERQLLRRGVGKPGYEYRLTGAGSVRLSRAYVPAFSALLTAVRDRTGAAEEEALLRAAGRLLSPEHLGGGRSLRDRVRAAVDFLNEMGGISAASEEKDILRIEGACCPLRALVTGNPLTCKAIEAMLESYIGVAVREECEKGDPPNCRLIIDQTSH